MVRNLYLIMNHIEFVHIQVMMKKKINYWRGFEEGRYIDKLKELPKGLIKKLIGRELTQDDNPVELKELK